MDPYGFPLKLELIKNKEGEEEITPVPNNPAYAAQLNWIENLKHEDYWQYLKDVDPYHYNELKHAKPGRLRRKSHHFASKRGKPKRLTFMKKVRNAKIMSNERGEVVKKFDKNSKYDYKEEKKKALLVNHYLENKDKVNSNLRKRTRAVSSRPVPLESPSRVHSRDKPLLKESWTPLLKYDDKRRELTYPKHDITLSKYLRDDTVSDKDKIDAVRKAIKGLRQLHKIGYAHNDVHLGNIMIESKFNKNVHIIDPETITYQEAEIEEDLQQEIVEFLDAYKHLLPYEYRKKIDKIPKPKATDDIGDYYYKILEALDYDFEKE